MGEQRKSIVVTGGASGIGLGVTRSFAEQGAHISVLDVNPQGASVVKDLSSEFPNASFSFNKADISNWNELAAAFKQIYQEQGRIEVVMANAGIAREACLIVDQDEPSKPNLFTLEVNLIGTIYTVTLAMHYIRKNAVVYGATAPSRGSIICTSSDAGLYACPVAPIYAASKFGVVGLVRSLARPLEKEAVQINALAPAFIETNISPDIHVFKHISITPMSTLERAVQQLVSDPSVTGQVAEIHGDHVTMREPTPYVDENAEKDMETFCSLMGYG